MKKRELPRYDWILLLLYVSLVLFGWLNIYAVGYEKEQGLSVLVSFSSNAGKQFFWMLGCIFLFIFSLFFDTQFYRSLAYVFYALWMGILAATLFWGIKVGGHTAWLRLGGFQLQPAEFAKLACALAIAKRLDKITANMAHVKTQLSVFGLMLAPAGFILLQGDLGSALVFCTFILVCYREGFSPILLVIGLATIILFVLSLLVPIHYLLIGTLSVGLVLVGIYKRSIKKIALIASISLTVLVFITAVDGLVQYGLKPHQQNRLKALVNPHADPLGIGWNITQSKIAIGSGGWWGKGFLKGTQTKYGFVPEQGKDFIFCTIGEEYGWIGSSLFIIVFMSLIMRILYLAERQRLRFARAYGYGVAAVLFFHFFINVGMTLSLLPVIGIPLPFISYGGSSLWTFSMMLFIFLKLDSERNQYISWKSLAID
jgi:rod shape determining protein RodA